MTQSFLVRRRVWFKDARNIKETHLRRVWTGKGRCLREHGCVLFRDRMVTIGIATARCPGSRSKKVVSYYPIRATTTVTILIRIAVLRSTHACRPQQRGSKAARFRGCYARLLKKILLSPLASVSDLIITMGAGNRPLCRATHKFNMTTWAGSRLQFEKLWQMFHIRIDSTELMYN